MSLSWILELKSPYPLNLSLFLFKSSLYLQKGKQVMEYKLFYFIWAQKGWGVCVNEGVISDIYFIYNFFFKMSYVQNESKNCLCEKDSVNINFYFSFFKFTFIFYFCFFIIKIWKTNIYKKKIESLTNSQGFIELKRIKQKTKRNRRREGRVKKRKK